MITINAVLFAFICAFACLGALIFLLAFIYFICGILDLTYYERHKKDYAENCPYFVEGKNENGKKEK